MVMSFFKLECLHTCWQLFLTSTLPFFEMTIDHYQENTTYQGEASTLQNKESNQLDACVGPTAVDVVGSFLHLNFPFVPKKPKTKYPDALGVDKVCMLERISNIKTSTILTCYQPQYPQRFLSQSEGITHA